MSKGIVYLIQPAELIDTNRYKIGCSQNTKLKRITNDYKNGTRYILIMECDNPFEVEKNIKILFRKQFKLIAGHEYFEGDEKLMKDSFIKTIDDYNSNKNTLNSSNNKKTPNITINNNITITADKNDIPTIINEPINDIYNNCCKKCKKEFSCKKTLKKHLNKKFPCDKETIYVCIQCNKPYYSKTDYTRHINRIYSCNKTNDEQIKLNNNDIQTNHPTENDNNINNNIITLNNYKCDDCGKFYTTKRSYKRHIKQYCKTGIKNELYNIIQNMQSQIDTLKNK